MNFGTEFGERSGLQAWSVMEETQIKKYFLGGLTEAEHQDFDNWLITGRDSVELIEEYEDQLIDDYVHGALSAKERTQFESHFLITPERRGKLTLVNNLIDVSARTAVEEKSGLGASVWNLLPFALPSQSWAARAVFASVAAALVLGGTWMAFRYWSSHKQEGQLQAEQTTGAEQTERDRRLAEETQQPPQQPAVNKPELAGVKPQPEQFRPKPEPRTPRVVAFMLSPGRVRDEEVINPLRIPPGTDLVRLKLELEADDYRSYRARLQRADGEVLWRQTLRRVGNKGMPLIARIPAKLLVDGEYILSLSGLTRQGVAEEVGNYYFKVVMR